MASSVSMDIGSPLVFRRQTGSPQHDDKLKDVNPDIEYEYVNKDSISHHLLCAICNDPFVNPVRSRSCGHVFCKHCIFNWIHSSSRNGSTSTCPVDRSEMSAALLEKDRMAYNLVEELSVYCINKKSGCLYVGHRQQMAAHLHKECEEVVLPCQYTQYGCDFKGKRKEYQNHLQICVFDKLKSLLHVVNSQTEEIKKLRTELDQLKEFKNQAEPILVKFNEHQLRRSSSAPTLPLPPPGVMNLQQSQPLNLEVGNTHEMITTGNHTWTFFVRGQNSSSLEGVVEKVVIGLHETFTQPNVTLTSHPFILHGRAWGTFDVKCQIFLHDKRVINIQQELSFGGKLVYTTYQIVGNTCKPIVHYME